MRASATIFSALSIATFVCVIAATRSSAGQPAKHRPKATASASAAAQPARETPTSDARADYADRRSALEAKRTSFAARLAKAKGDDAREAVLADARSALLDAFEGDLFPAWTGTTWDFNGTSQVPGEGKIACGYFVTTLLSHAGFDVRRAKLAQQASEIIVKTLADDDQIWRFRKGDAKRVLEKVHALGDGLYVVGLDNHAGFLLETAGNPTRFCHASYVEPAIAHCEPAASASAFESNYHVVGRVTGDATLARWIEGDAFETRVK